MIDGASVVDSFERSRPRLRAIAYRMLGSLTAAEDALQETWLRATRAQATGPVNVEGWLTTIVARVCLNMLRQRQLRREQPLPVALPDPIVSLGGQLQPEDEALLAESVGLALQVVLGTLSPPERLAFVLHDMFDLPFEEISRILDRTPAAARQLASRARRRVKDRQRAAVDAFFAAGRRGDFAVYELARTARVPVRARHGPRRSTPTIARCPGQTLLRGSSMQRRRASTGRSSIRLRSSTGYRPAL